VSTNLSGIKKVDEAAQAYIGKGWRPIPVWPNSKKPRDKRWPEAALSANDVPGAFVGEMNVGLALGDVSGGLVDVDLDAPEALAVADTFLMETGLEHGRPSKPRSHRWYVSPAVKTTQFKDTDQMMLVELRSTGGQTVVPPSRHPSGELLAWSKPGDPPGCRER
jgi:hypothetical protein